VRAVERFLAVGLPLYCGGVRGRYVALTFDDGPGPETALALRVLRRARVPATFFLVGRQVARYPRLPNQERMFGALGDHTWSHRLLVGLAQRDVVRELALTKAAIERKAGVAVGLFRPPYGAHNRTIDALARRLGLLEVIWSVDSTDSRPGAQTTWPRIAGVIRRFVHPGAIVLMHEDRGQTIAALKFRILPDLRRRGLIPVTVPELLVRDPPTITQLRAGPQGCSGGR
jgi:peptidoglycan/xylan/chitin deacetylase (PgdA/CDA1 family)